MQQGAQVYFNVAGIGPQRFLRRAPAEPVQSQVAQKLDTQLGGQALETAADGRLMHAEQAADLEDRPVIEVVAGEQEPLFRRKPAQRNGYRLRQPRQRIWLGRGRGFRRGRFNCLQGAFAARPAQVVHVALGERRAQPAQKRSTAGVGSQG